MFLAFESVAALGGPAVDVALAAVGELVLSGYRRALLVFQSAYQAGTVNPNPDDRAHPAPRRRSATAAPASASMEPCRNRPCTSWGSRTLAVDEAWFARPRLSRSAGMQGRRASGGQR